MRDGPDGNHLCPSLRTLRGGGAPSLICNIAPESAPGSFVSCGPKSQPVAFPLLCIPAQRRDGESPCIPQLQHFPLHSPVENEEVSKISWKLLPFPFPHNEFGHLCVLPSARARAGSHKHPNILSPSIFSLAGASS